MTALRFALDAGDVLDPEPRAIYDAGAVFGAQDAPVVLTVAWLDEPPGVQLADVVHEDLSRMLDESASDSNDELGLAYSDVGFLWAMAPADDLAAGEFQQLRCDGESS